jgi:hypothetical protein
LSVGDAAIVGDNLRLSLCWQMVALRWHWITSSVGEPLRTIENLSFWLMQLSMIMLRFHSLPGSKEKPEVRRVVFWSNGLKIFNSVCWSLISQSWLVRWKGWPQPRKQCHLFARGTHRLHNQKDINGQSNMYKVYKLYGRSLRLLRAIHRPGRISAQA